MGKATIVSSKGAGLYSATINIARERITTEAADLDSALAELEPIVAEAEAKLALAQETLDADIDAVRAEIEAPAAQSEWDYYERFLPPDEIILARDALISPKLVALQTAAIQSAAERDKAAAQVSRLKLREISMNNRKASLEAIPADAQQDLWCADFSEDLTGEVATAEIPGEGQEKVILMPGYAPSGYNVATDGQLFDRRSMTGPQAFFNAAVLPGWQRHKPTFRVGVVSNIDEIGGDCTVTLDAALSSASGLPVNQQSVLTNVPILYMECDAAAFANDDRVVVQFVNQSWETPVVIGFEQEPVLCGFPSVAFYQIIPRFGGCSDFDWRIDRKYNAGQTTQAAWANGESNAAPGFAIVDDTIYYGTNPAYWQDEVDIQPREIAEIKYVKRELGIVVDSGVFATAFAGYNKISMDASKEFLWVAEQEPLTCPDESLGDGCFRGGCDDIGYSETAIRVRKFQLSDGAQSGTWTLSGFAAGGFAHVERNVCHLVAAGTSTIKVFVNRFESNDEKCYVFTAGLDGAFGTPDVLDYHVWGACAWGDVFAILRRDGAAQSPCQGNSINSVPLVADVIGATTGLAAGLLCWPQRAGIALGETHLFCGAGDGVRMYDRTTWTLEKTVETSLSAGQMGFDKINMPV